MKTCCQAGAPAAPQSLAPQRPLPAPRAQLPPGGEQGPALRKPRPVPRLPGWRGAGRRPERRLGHSWAGVGRRDTPLPAPSCHIESRNHNSPWGTGGGEAQRRPEQGWGRRTTASWLLSPPQPGSGAEEGHPCEAAVGRGGQPPPHPVPELLLTGLLPGPSPRVAAEGEGLGGRAASDARGVGVESRDSPPPCAQRPHLGRRAGTELLRAR